jgi:hypothetical protein
MLLGGQSEPEALGEGSVQEQAISPEYGTTLVVPEVMEDGLEAEDSSVEVPMTMQSGEIKKWVDPPKHRNTRRRKQSDTTRA